MNFTGRADKYDRTPTYKKSEDVQQFKIGRIKYNLPSYLVDSNGEQYWLFFKFGEGFMWEAGYEGNQCVGPNIPLSVETETFNKALKALHAKMKQL